VALTGARTSRGGPPRRPHTKRAPPLAQWVTVTGDQHVVHVIRGSHVRSSQQSEDRSGPGPRRPARRPDVLLRRRMPRVTRSAPGG
jgi:hypothetical protein